MIESNRNKAIFFGALIIFFIWKHGKMESVSIDKALFIDMLIAATVLIWEGFNRAWKYDSPHIVTPSTHHSFDGTIHHAGPHIMIKLGGILTDIRMEGKDGTIVLPRDEVFEGEGVVITPIVVEETDPRLLPPKVYAKIKRTGKKFKAPYLYGKATISAWNTDPHEIARLNAEIETLNQRINWYQEEFPQVVGEIDKYMSHMKRVVGEEGPLAKLRWGKEENE